jgi:hypothetical protein
MGAEGRDGYQCHREVLRRTGLKGRGNLNVFGHNFGSRVYD